MTGSKSAKPVQTREKVVTIDVGRAKGIARSNATEVYETILAAIESGQFVSGQRIREQDLAERYGISRTPIREALQRLEVQGVLTHVPHLGCIVTTLNYTQIADLYFLREILEGAAARLAAANASEAETEILADMLDKDRAHTGDFSELAESNRQFHRRINLFARNHFLKVTLENMRLHHSLLAGTTPGVLQHRGSQALGEHDIILHAIKTHDPDAAEAAARAHVRHAFKARIAQIPPV